VVSKTGEETSMSDRRLAVVVLLVGLAGGVRVSPPTRAASDAAPDARAGAEDDVTQGALRVSRGGTVVECPLRHTDVQAEVSGFLARVRVTQTFDNPYDEAIEAVYVFPLPASAAVDEMTMVVGERRVVGLIRRRAEARAVYEQAVARGQTASLLEQERPNIFTQTVGNIRPGQPVRIEISYVDVLPYDRGAYEFHFPMVVGPRYIPGAPLPGRDQGEGWSADTTRVPDASRITPPVLEPGFRTGHDVSLRVSIEAGVPIRDLDIATHRARVERPARSRATAVLARSDAIPNKDFVLTYKVAGERPETAVLAHATGREPGYFLLMMQPRDMEGVLGQAPPRDVCFLIDVSGSMSGRPTAKVREAMRLFFERMRAQDRIQVITFAGQTARLFDSYVPAAPANLQIALGFTDKLQGGGGTEMLAGIRAALADPVEPERVRVVVMLTDGYIGNEAEIIGEVGRRAGDQLRFWTVGIGSSPNRFLLDGVAKQGGGMSAVLGLDDDPTGLVGRIAERLQRAQLSRIQLDWGGLDVSETYPARVPELWSGRPVVLLGRYQGAGPTTVRISGVAEGEPVSFPLEITLPEHEPVHGVLAKAWARRKIEDLSDQLAVAQGDPEPLSEEITELALQYRLMSAYTSFVAVDEAEGPMLEEPRPPRRVLVPLPMPDGVSYEGVFGEGEESLYLVAEQVHVGGRVNRKAVRSAPPPPPLPAARARRGVAGGVAGGVPGGVVGGVAGGVPTPPPYPASARRAERGVPMFVAPMESRDVSRAPAHHDEAVHALERARALLARKDWAMARREGRLAWALADAHRRLEPWGRDDLADRAAELCREADEALQQVAMTAAPALRQRLDLVVRNADLTAALDAVARGAGVTVAVAPAALEDAAVLTGLPLRVAWLDLRRATGAQALTWLVQPFGLDWVVENKAVLVRSPRRAAAASVWTYDVRDLAGADDAELEESAARAVFAPVVRLLGTGHLLVMGEAPAQARAVDFLARLRKGAPWPNHEHAQARRAALAHATLDRTSWALLAAACHGAVDPEPASLLLEAVADRDVLHRLASGAPLLVLRAAWTVAQARAVAPDDETLRRVADTMAAVLPTAMAAGKDDHAAIAYAALLRELPAALRPAGLDAGPTVPGDARARLRALARGPVEGDDEAVLAGLGQRLRGHEDWNAGRYERASMADAAGVSAAALRVLSRLERAPLAGL
jgi:Ca-activated chloride channel family protein